MSFKRPFNELSIGELSQKLRRLVSYFEDGGEITDTKLDAYLLLTKRIEELEFELGLSEKVPRIPF